MYQFNDFTKATSQFADVAANANRLALENIEKSFGLQLAAFEENTTAAFAFSAFLAKLLMPLTTISSPADALPMTFPPGHMQKV